jgi:hypothetical protein
LRGDEAFEIDLGDISVDVEKTALEGGKRGRNDQRLSTLEIVVVVSMGAAAFGVAVGMVAVVVMVRRVVSAKRGEIVGVSNDPGGLRQYFLGRMTAEKKAGGGKEEGQQDEADDDRSMKGDSDQLAGLPVKFAHSI